MSLRVGGKWPCHRCGQIVSGAHMFEDCLLTLTECKDLGEVIDKFMELQRRNDFYRMHLNKFLNPTDGGTEQPALGKGAR